MMMERLKVLIVEDSKAILLLYEAGLYESVFDRKFAEDGTEALKVYETWKPEIIVLDLMLPGMSGYALLREIRENREDEETTVIVATSLSDRDTVKDMLRLGIQGYLVKPFSHREVGGRILEYFQEVNPERAKTAILEYRAIQAEPEREFGAAEQ